jgi:hypothetical protein
LGKLSWSNVFQFKSSIVVMKQNKKVLYIFHLIIVFVVKTYLTYFAASKFVELWIMKRWPICHYAVEHLMSKFTGEIWEIKICEKELKHRWRLRHPASHFSHPSLYYYDETHFFLTKRKLTVFNSLINNFNNTYLDLISK